MYLTFVFTCFLICIFRHKLVYGNVQDRKTKIKIVSFFARNRYQNRLVVLAYTRETKSYGEINISYSIYGRRIVNYVFSLWVWFIFRQAIHTRWKVFFAILLLQKPQYKYFEVICNPLNLQELLGKAFLRIYKIYRVFRQNFLIIW